LVTGAILADGRNNAYQCCACIIRLQAPCDGRKIIARRRLTQAADGEPLGVNQPKVSALMNYKLEGFSVDRLMTFLTALDRDVEIVIRKKPRSRPAGRISVVAARWSRSAERDLRRSTQDLTWPPTRVH
jgi:predicted XRE-type DNA-binding protein